jgi:hypothetical protein
VFIKNKGKRAGHTERVSEKATSPTPKRTEGATMMEQQKMVKISVEVRSGMLSGQGPGTEHKEGP